jgi:hypothetical protein
MSRNSIDHPPVYDSDYRDPNLRDDQRTVPVDRPLERPVERPVTPMGGVVERPVAPMDEAVGTRAPTDGDVVSGDRIRWGGIWAGTLTAFTIFLVLEFLGVGLGLITAGRGGTTATSAISTLIAGLIAFFIGGWVAESSSAARGFSSRLLTGFMVWALVTTLILALSIMGATSVIGSVAGQMINGGTTVTTGNGITTTQMASNVQLAGWSAFIWLVVSAIAAIIGGLLGVPRRVMRWRRAW